MSAGSHVPCPTGTIVNGKWKVLGNLGAGNFAKVYKCQEVNAQGHPVKRDGGYYALKIIKKEYARDAQVEQVVLDAIEKANSVIKLAVGKRHKVVRCLENFTYQQCPCMVFELAGPTLRHCRMDLVRQRPDQFKAFVKEMLVTLAFLHDDAGVCHTDLKPENILVENPQHDVSQGIGSGWTVADLGSASFYNPQNPDKDLISTRPYRAPEVILGLPWTTKADMFSMGCIFYEIYVGGKPLFDIPDDDAIHLASFEARIGPMPRRLLQMSQRSQQFYNSKGQLRRTSTGTNGPRTHLNRLISTEPLLLSFLVDLLRMDPDRRASAKQALQHPFITAKPINSSVSAPPKVSVQGFAAGPGSNFADDLNQSFVSSAAQSKIASEVGGGGGGSGGNVIKVGSGADYRKGNDNSALDQFLRLRRFTNFYGIERTDEQLKQVVERYTGAYDTMWRQLEKKYGLEQGAAGEGPSASGAAAKGPQGVSVLYELTHSSTHGDVTGSKSDQFFEQSNSASNLLQSIKQQPANARPPPHQHQQQQQQQYQKYVVPNYKGQNLTQQPAHRYGPAGSGRTPLAGAGSGGTNYIGSGRSASGSSSSNGISRRNSLHTKVGGGSPGDGAFIPLLQAQSKGHRPHSAYQQQQHQPYSSNNNNYAQYTNNQLLARNTTSTRSGSNTHNHNQNPYHYQQKSSYIDPRLMRL